MSSTFVSTIALRRRGTTRGRSWLTVLIIALAAAMAMAGNQEAQPSPRDSEDLALRILAMFNRHDPHLSQPREIVPVLRPRPTPHEAVALDVSDDLRVYLPPTARDVVIRHERSLQADTWIHFKSSSVDLILYVNARTYDRSKFRKELLLLDRSQFALDGELERDLAAMSDEVSVRLDRDEKGGVEQPGLWEQAHAHLSRLTDLELERLCTSVSGEDIADAAADPVKVMSHAMAVVMRSLREHDRGVWDGARVYDVRLENLTLLVTPFVLNTTDADRRRVHICQFFLPTGDFWSWAFVEVREPADVDASRLEEACINEVLALFGPGKVVIPPG